MKAFTVFLIFALLGSTYDRVVENQDDLLYSSGQILLQGDVPNVIDGIKTEDFIQVSITDNELDPTPCVDVWRTYYAPMNGTTLGKVCVVNDVYFCQNTYYRSEHVIGSGQCFFDVE